MPVRSVMKEEIFGPILPIKTYEDLDEVIDALTADAQASMLAEMGA